MKPQSPQIINTIMNAPLPMMLEKLGASIANAQAALDANSIRLANEMSTLEIAIGDTNHNLISLGFAPTFYAFTEASIEIKMEFSLSESEEYGGSISFNIGDVVGDNNKKENTENVPEQNSDDTKKGKPKKGINMFGLAINGHYSRKFSMSSEASSSIAAKIISLPAPDVFNELLRATITKE